MADLDSRDNIARFVELFYQRILKDPELAPIFVDVARIDLAIHLPHIVDYWCKLLLGDRVYTRHTMQIHRDLHAHHPLTPADFERWLALFTSTLQSNFTGAKTERAELIATRIACNMQGALC